MFLEFLGCLFYIGLVILAELKRRKDAQGTYFYPSFSEVDASTKPMDGSNLYTDNMSEFEKAVTFVNSGRYHYTDVAVIIQFSFYLFRSWLSMGCTNKPPREIILRLVLLPSILWV